MDTSTTFVGASGTSFPPQHIAGATAPNFSDAEPTRTDVPATPAPPAAVPEPAGLADWLSSDAAKPYRDRWVLLDATLNVLDSDESPSQLLGRHPEVAAPLIVFVQPRDIALAV